MCREAVVCGLEQMAVCAARGGWEVTSLVRVTAQARAARGVGRVAMPAVTKQTTLMFGLRVQARQGCDGVARRAGRWFGHASRPVWPMATEASACKLAVRRGRFVRVARRTGHPLARARVRLMATRTSLVPRRRTGGLSGVTSAARCRHSSGVRLVTAHALLMTGVRFAMGIGVASHAHCCATLRMVRQALMAGLTSRVARSSCRQRELLLMTSLTGCVLCRCDLEAVRGVAARACGPRMKRPFGVRLLVTAAACPRYGWLLCASGVGVVTGDAAPRPRAFRMIRVNVPMTASARSCRAVFDVVRLMAARAVCVRGHLRLGEHEHVCVARAARNRLLGGKLMRSVTAHAGGVTTGEQCARGHDRSSFAVTVGACGERLRSWRVLMGMAGSTGPIGSFAERGVRRRDAGVAACAGA